MRRNYNPPTLFGKFIHEEMKQRGVSARRFAQELGISRDSLLRMLIVETDLSRMTLDVLLSLAEKLEVNPLILIALAASDHAETVVRQCERSKPASLRPSVQSLVSTAPQVVNAIRRIDKLMGAEPGSSY